MIKKFKAMIISVGGTSAPVIHSLNSSKPEYVCFFVSRESKKMLEQEVLPCLLFKPIFSDLIITQNAELLTDCYSVLKKNLPNILEKWEVVPSEVCVDYTGGTKTMSVALALATIDNSCCYSYVGGDERSKGGVGVVVNGKEKMWFLENPWDEIAYSSQKEASILFNKARYASAAEVLEKCLDRIGKEKKPFFKALVEMVEGYELWDCFKHKDARVKLYRCKDTISTYAFGSDKKEIKGLSKKIDENLNFLDHLQGSPKFYFFDLLANAKRRAELERKFDDAVARLYRAIEVLAQGELKEEFEINTSDVKADKIPEELRDEFIVKYRDDRDQKIKLPLFASYQLLNELGDSLAQEFFKYYEKEIRPILNIRNQSILAHGFNAVSEDSFQKLLLSVMKFSGTKEEDIPEFPVLNI
ncbi:MAG: TIGR02710 family CRISPR-associated protein [Syntrophaceae bacterium]|nr:TIGR02710 family CRISPR-associated protein [Syntrophaceae bacterium]